MILDSGLLFGATLYRPTQGNVLSVNVTSVFFVTIVVTLEQWCI